MKELTNLVFIQEQLFEFFGGNNMSNKTCSEFMRE